MHIYIYNKVLDMVAFLLTAITFVSDPRTRLVLNTGILWS